MINDLQQPVRTQPGVPTLDEPVHPGDERRPEAGDTPPAETAGAQAVPSRLTRFWLFLRSFPLPVWAALLLTSAVAGLHTVQYTPLSPVDEIHHVDYAFHLMNGDLVVGGDHFTAEAQKALACRGIDMAFSMPCDAPNDLEDMPEEGRNTATGHAPLYYLVPAALGLVGQAVGVGGDLVTVLRLSSLLWWALFVGLAWRMFRELGVHRWAAAGGILLTAATPVVMQANSMVNNDATALVAGAALTLGGLLWDRDALKLRWLLLLAAVAILLKATNVVAVVAVALFLLIRYWQRHGSLLRTPGAPARRTVLAVLGLGATAAAVGAGWVLTAGVLGADDVEQTPMNRQFYASEFEPGWLISSLDAFLSPIAPEFIDSLLVSQTVALVSTFTNYGLMGLAIVGAVLADPGSRVRALAGATALVAMFGSIIFVVTNYAAAHTFVPITSRYGLALVPMMLAVGLTAVRWRSGRIAIVVIGLGVLAGMTRVILV
jgi:hypothetical protein